MPAGAGKSVSGCRAATGAGQCLHGADRVGEWAGGPEVIGEGFDDCVVVRVAVFEGVGNPQMQPGGQLLSRGLGD